LDSGVLFANEFGEAHLKLFHRLTKREIACAKNSHRE
jgi:hypothetical protein